jgi:hypothetical protein
MRIDFAEGLKGSPHHLLDEAALSNSTLAATATTLK